MGIIAFAKHSALFIIVIMRILEQTLSGDIKEPKSEKRGFHFRFIIFFCIKPRDGKGVVITEFYFISFKKKKKSGIHD